MIRTSKLLAALCLVGAAGVANAQSSRDYVSVVGSSTVYPFATVVAENFGRQSDFRTPKIESTGSGGGIKLFCAGVGAQHPDITNASRRIKASEVQMCAENGVQDIVEVKVGYDGIVVANTKGAPIIPLTRKDLFLALAKHVPQGDDESLVENPYTNWNEIRADLPATKIEVMGPPPTSGTRDAFVELVMESGCKEFASLKALKDSYKDRFKEVCHSLREDGAFVEAGENDNLIVQKLQTNPNALGIFGFSFLDQNYDVVQGSPIDGEEPTFESIADGAYPVSRALYFYAKKAHVGVIPGLKEFLAEFVSEDASGEEGYLADRGLIPMPLEEHEKVVASVENLVPLQLESL